jgi:hypothetical protein
MISPGFSAEHAVHDAILDFLDRECSVSEAAYATLHARASEWAESASTKIAINPFSPIMLLEQVRREFDETADFVTFALVATELQWGPRLMKVSEFPEPVWIMALQGFPQLIAEAQASVRVGGSHA